MLNCGLSIHNIRLKVPLLMTSFPSFRLLEEKDFERNHLSNCFQIYPGALISSVKGKHDNKTVQ
jgi:hypothetical protein